GPFLPPFSDGILVEHGFSPRGRRAECVSDRSLSCPRYIADALFPQIRRPYRCFCPHGVSSAGPPAPATAAGPPLAPLRSGPSLKRSNLAGTRPDCVTM